MDYYPIFTDLRGRYCLVVGGGSVARRKVTSLNKAGARITVNAPRIHPVLRELAQSGEISIAEGEFEEELLTGKTLVVAATDNPRLNKTIFELCERSGRLVNVVDDPQRCNFLIPAVVDRSPVAIAISTGGAAPLLARMLRERVEKLVPVRIGEVATLARRWRDVVRLRIPNRLVRRRFWESIFAGPIADHQLAGRRRRVHAAMTRLLDGALPEPRGEVYLVGAGPGGADLLTIRALQLMQQADVVIHDRLVSDAVLELVRRDAERIDVGKRPGGGSSQADINSLMIESAKAGLKVCRLKGGDPFVFGRGGEELDALEAAGVDYQIVPGITAAIGCAAAAGIPLTHRDDAHAVTFLTANTNCPIDWRSMADQHMTLVIYMGVGKVKEIRNELIRYGRDGHTPVAIVGRGTTEHQRIATGSLTDLPELVSYKQIESPAVVYIGAVARYAKHLVTSCEPVAKLDNRLSGVTPFNGL